MGEALKQEVKLPIWIIGLLLSLLITMFTYTSIWGQTKKQVENNTKAIEALQTDKADKNLLVLILDGQKRIEDKLDKHISTK
jgi:hypothetical protein